MRLKLKGLLTKITQMLAETQPIVYVKRQNFNGFDGRATYVIPCDTVTGYTCVGVVGWQAGGSDQVTANACDVYVDVSAQNIILTNYNYFSGSQYAFNFNLLYVKTRFAV